jgi:hypothetical protein
MFLMTSQESKQFLLCNVKMDYHALIGNEPLTLLFRLLVYIDST